ncbi:MAG: hypothetical protein H6815_00390 [Phycisphaeraceae bacterium]|nr:hypothetical protein [Phycisphaerales bacterium]MCB9858882.1 hypothetical protein [Phycisphaeraceae bacterium]
MRRYKLLILSILIIAISYACVAVVMYFQEQRDGNETTKSLIAVGLTLLLIVPLLSVALQLGGKIEVKELFNWRPAVPSLVRNKSAVRAASFVIGVGLLAFGLANGYAMDVVLVGKSDFVFGFDTDNNSMRKATIDPYYKYMLPRHILPIKIGSMLVAWPVFSVVAQRSDNQ